MLTVSRPGTDALGVQNARSIRTFADACVFLSKLCFFSVFSDDFLIHVISLSCPSNPRTFFLHTAHTSTSHLTSHTSYTTPNTQPPLLGYRKRAPPRIRRDRPYSPSRVCLLRPGARRRRTAWTWRIWSSVRWREMRIFFLGGVNFWIGRPPVVISSPVFFVSLVCIVVKVYLHCPISYYVVTSLPFCVLQFFRIHTTAYRFWIATCYLSLYFNDTIFA